MAAAAEEAEEQTEFDVSDRPGEKKIQVIKEVRALTSLGRRRPRTWSTPPKPVPSASPRTRPTKAKAQLEAAGASVELK